MMTKQITHKLDKLKIIYDNDLGILDFICDLQDKRTLHDLQKFIKYADDKPAMLLCDCYPDNIWVFIVAGDPFKFNEGDNKLVLYADNDINGLCLYFTHMVQHTPEEHEYYAILQEIRLYLSQKWDEMLKYDDYVKHGRAT